MSWQLLYADEDLLVVDKPSGLLCQPGRGPDNQDSLVSQVAFDFPGVRIVHRLDRDTSGVIVLARSADAHRELSRQFEQRLVSKTYIAVVAGRTDEAGEIELPLGKDWQNPPRYRVDHETGKPSQTSYQVIGRLADHTRLCLRPRTGRSHQLRVHLCAIGHPIIGDNLYAPEALRPPGQRLLLHAWQLTIDHPSRRTLQRFEAELAF